MIHPQNATELREQAARCVRIAATLNPEDAAVLIGMARESLARANEMDGGPQHNGHDVNALIELALGGNKPRVKDGERPSTTRPGPQGSDQTGGGR